MNMIKTNNNYNYSNEYMYDDDYRGDDDIDDYNNDVA
jgi:hypothetical protein